MTGTKRDINGEEFEYCTLHSSDAKNRLEAFAWCHLATENEPSEVESCPVFTQRLLDIMKDFDQNRDYSQVLFPAKVVDGEIVREATEGHPDPTGLVDVRHYYKKFINDGFTGVIEPVFEDQNPDGTWDEDE